MNAEEIVSAVRSRGSDARDVRDAVHEAMHAIEAGAEAWDRESIHDALMDIHPGRRGLSSRMAAEIRARAAEWSACDACGVAYDVDHWSLVCFMETFKNEGAALPHDTLVTAITQCRGKDGDTLFARVVEHLLGTA